MERWCVVRSLIATLYIALLPGCSRGSDMGPVGGGLAVIGLAMIVAAIINTLAGKGGDDE